MKYYIGGVNGVGKSSLIKSIISLYADSYYYHGSSLLMDKLGIKHNDYEALRKIPGEYKNIVFSKIISDLIEEIDCNHNTKKMYLFDAHFLNLVDGKIFNVLNEDIIKNMDCIVLVKADIDEILKRIKEDKSRNRSLFRGNDSSVFESYAIQTEQLAKNIAKTYGKLYIELYNSEGSIDLIAKNFIKYHNNISSI